MKPRSHAQPHDSLGDAGRQLSRWRRTRRRGTRIPAPLWAAAVEAAREHGVSRTASTLRLDYYGLKKRLESTRLTSTKSAPKSSAAQEPANGGGFLEIPLLAPTASECVFEIENGHGVRLRVALKGAASAELEVLARTFWSLAQ